MDESDSRDIVERNIARFGILGSPTFLDCMRVLAPSDFVDRGWSSLFLLLSQTVDANHRIDVKRLVLDARLRGIDETCFGGHLDVTIARLMGEHSEPHQWEYYANRLKAFSMQSAVRDAARALIVSIDGDPEACDPCKALANFERRVAVTRTEAPTAIHSLMKIVLPNQSRSSKAPTKLF